MKFQRLLTRRRARSLRCCIGPPTGSVTNDALATYNVSSDSRARALALPPDVGDDIPPSYADTEGEAARAADGGWGK